MALTLISESPIFHALALETIERGQDAHTIELLEARLNEVTVANRNAEIILAIESGLPDEPLEGKLVEGTVNTASMRVIEEA